MSNVANEIENCSKCGNLPKLRCNSIKKGRSRILILGESPAKDGWIISGRAFYKQAGKLQATGKILNKLLNLCGLTIDDINFTEVCKCIISDRKRLRDCCNNCKPILFKQIDEFDCDIILPMGQFNYKDSKLRTIEILSPDTDLKSLFKAYQNYVVRSKSLTNFYKTVYELVSIEAPITEELLLKKVVSLFGNEKVTRAVRSKFNVLMRLNRDVYKIKDYYVVDKDMQIEMRIPKAGDEPRDILMISNDELASGMLVIIKNNIGITQEGLFTTISNLLGFTRRGNKITCKLIEVLVQLIEDKKVKKMLTANYFWLKKTTYNERIKNIVVQRIQFNFY